MQAEGQFGIEDEEHAEKIQQGQLDKSPIEKHERAGNQSKKDGSGHRASEIIKLIMFVEIARDGNPAQDVPNMLYQSSKRIIDEPIPCARLTLCSMVDR